MEPALQALASIPKGRSHQKMEGLVLSTKTTGPSYGDPERESRASWSVGSPFLGRLAVVGIVTLPTTVALGLAVCMHPPPVPPFCG